MNRYKPKGDVVLAEQLTEDNVETIARLCGGQIIDEIDERDPEKRYKAINVPTLNGVERLSVGMWFVKNNFNLQAVMGDTAFHDKYTLIH